MLYPFTFTPIFKERVWGGRKLAELYGKALPPGVPIGESWEITDRPEGVSVIANGPLAGKTLRWVMEHHPRELLGNARPASEGRFPLLVKLLDSRDKLSLQVHPPASKAAALRGEPKTEMWYFADTDPGADIFVGLKHGVTRGEFERRTADGTVAECFHRIEVRRGDAMFLPSGRVHALGAGSVLFEIQQNSDTTYRVFDWNRVGLDGKPRDLHVAQALESIEFADFEPGLALRGGADGNPAVPLVRHELFDVTLCRAAQGQTAPFKTASAVVIGLVEGRMSVKSVSGEAALRPGGFCVVPASVGNYSVVAETSAKFLLAEPK
jgi:mannose-6-phosphate isomerase